MPPQIPLSMAVYDFLPNTLFGLGAYWMWQRRYRSLVFAIGSLMVFLNGLCKASWKLILALGGPDVDLLNQVFVVLLSMGFLLMFVGVLEVQRGEKQALARASLLLMAPWKIPFLLIATLSAVGVYLLWISAALRQRAWLPVTGFAMALVATLAMSGLSGGDFNLDRQWVAQTVNTIGQACFLTGSYHFTRRTKRAG